MTRARSRPNTPPTPTRAAAPAGEDDTLVPTTLRLDPETRRGLLLLQEALGVTLNKLMNEGLALYVAQRTAALEREVQANLNRIRRYRQRDPTFSKAFARIADEEAAHARDDPAEGNPYLEQPGEQPGPAVAAVRQLIASRR